MACIVPADDAIIICAVRPFSHTDGEHRQNRVALSMWFWCFSGARNMKHQALLLWTSFVVPASAASVAWNTDAVQILLTSSLSEGTFNLQLGASR